MNFNELLVVVPYPHKSGIFNLFTKAYIDHYKKMGFIVKQQKIYFWERKLWYSLKWLYLMRFLLKKDIAIICHQHTIPSSGPFIVPFLLVARILRHKCITISHETVDTYAKHLPGSLKWLAYFYELLVVHLSQYYVVHTSIHKNEIQSFTHTQNLKMIPHPVISVSVRKYERVVWGFYGLISYKKGVDLLIDAYQDFPPETFPPLKIIGATAPDGETYLDKCKQKVKQEFLSLITFSGMILEEEKADVFSKIALMILPYRYISQSGVLAETCMHRIPYLTSDLPYFKDFNMNFRCGVLFEANNKESLKAQMCHLSQHPIEITDNELAHLENELSVERCAEKIINLFLE